MGRKWADIRKTLSSEAEERIKQRIQEDSPKHGYPLGTVPYIVAAVLTLGIAALMLADHNKPLAITALVTGALCIGTLIFDKPPRP